MVSNAWQREVCPLREVFIIASRGNGLTMSLFSTHLPRKQARLTPSVKPRLLGSATARKHKLQRRTLFIEQLEDRRVLAGWLLTSSVVGADPVMDLAQDSTGNTYAAGYFAGTMTIGSATLTSNGSGEDLFVAKLDPTGNLLWAQRFGGTGRDFATGLDVGSDGSVYVTGSFYGAMTIGNTTLVSKGGKDAFVLKFDANANAVWARRMGGGDGSVSSNFDDQGSGVAVTNDGAVYVTGEFRETADFGSINISSAGAGDQFVTKLSDEGTFRWVRQLGGADNQMASDVVTGTAGDVFVVGNTVAGYDAAGNLKWKNEGAASVGGPIYQDALSGKEFLYTAELYGGAIRKLDALTGAEVWRRTTGLNDELTFAVTTDADGNVYVVKAFWSGMTPDFDPGSGTFYVDNLNSNGYNTVLLKLSSAADFLSARRVVGGTGGYQFAHDIEVDTGGNVFLAGEWGSTGEFDVGDATAVRTSPSGEGQGFILKLTQGLGAISGTVFNDQNQNGIRDGNEPRLADAIVYLDLNGNEALDAGEPSAASTWDGTYLIMHVAPGSYTLRQSMPAGWIGTKPASSVYNIAVAVDQFLGDRMYGDYYSGAPTKFYVVNDAAGDRTYEYGPTGSSVENYGLAVGNTAPRGAASTASGDKVWVVDANRTVSVYTAAALTASGGLLGSWSALSLASNAVVEGIATDGSNVWIVDSRTDKVYAYTAAASRLAGSQYATGSFSLNSSNKNPKDMVTDGMSIWVIDDSNQDKVFKYTIAGVFLGSWVISTSGAGSPTGITIDPSNVSNIWIVDSGTRRVYQYDAAAGLTSGTRSASSNFSLASGNMNPQGIADPPAATSLKPSQLEPNRSQPLALGESAALDLHAQSGEPERPFSGRAANSCTSKLVDETIADVAGRPGIVEANLLSELVSDVAATITRRKTARSDFGKLDDYLLKVLGKLNE